MKHNDKGIFSIVKRVSSQFLYEPITDESLVQLKHEIEKEIQNTFGFKASVVLDVEKSTGTVNLVDIIPEYIEPFFHIGQNAIQEIQISEPKEEKQLFFILSKEDIEDALEEYLKEEGILDKIDNNERDSLLSSLFQEFKNGFRVDELDEIIKAQAFTFLKSDENSVSVVQSVNERIMDEAASIGYF